MIDAKRELEERHDYGNGDCAQLIAWRLHRQLAGSAHNFKYRFALIVDGVCVLRYDNEPGKGDHKHVGEKQYPIDFTGIPELRRSFLVEAGRWLRRHGRGER